MLSAAQSKGMERANWRESLTDVDEDRLRLRVVPNAFHATNSGVEQGTQSATSIVHAQDPEAMTMPADDSSEQPEDIQPAIVFPGEPPAPVTFQALQEWEGYVTEIKDTEFTARLTDLTAGATYAGEEADIPLDKIPEEEAKKIQVGSIFRWVIGYQRRAGSEERLSRIVFRDLPAITKSDLLDGQKWAHKITATFGQWTDAGTSGGRPGEDEIEVVLFGPGYGESIVIHIGDGSWIIVDSCINTEGKPRALEYLDSIGVNAGQEVDLVVATHWHDDHIRGMATLVEVCTNAHFCCANTLLNEEFLAAIDALESRHLTVEGSGVREIYRVLKSLHSKTSPPKFASANRLIHSHGKCEIWSLSPSDAAFQSFLQTVGALFPREGETKTRIPSISPNDFSVVLWIDIEDVAVLLGSDLERNGWIEILNSRERPKEKATAFKVPHHGSEGADDRRCGRVCLRQIRTHSSHRGKEAITPYPAKRMCRGYFLILQTPMRARKGIGLLVLPDTPIARLPEPSEVPVSSFESWI